MAKRSKLKSPHTESSPKSVVHDRRAADLPFNARIAVIDIDDAYGIPDGAVLDKRRREWVSAGQPKVQVVRNLRGDPLGAMLAATQITQHQYDSGVEWQKAYQRSEVGAVRAIDPTREAVDGGTLPDPINETQRKALDDLRRAKSALGWAGDSLVRDILGRGMTIAKAADARGLRSEADRKFLGKRFRECLDVLGEVFGLANKPRRIA